MGTSWKGPYVEQLIHSVSGMLSWKYPEIYVHRLLGKGRGGGSWTCRTFTCGFRNLYQCGRGSHWSELDYIMHKEDNKWPWIMPTLRGRQKNRNWWTSPGMSFCWGWRRTRQGQGSGHQVGRAFQEGTCMPSAREYYRETIGFCRWVRMAREKGMGNEWPEWVWGCLWGWQKCFGIRYRWWLHNCMINVPGLYTLTLLI